jgi:GT2 family glycosyltransferase
VLPLVTVAILAYNRREALSVTLSKVLGELDHPADRLEVIVVDNASTDGTAEMVRERFSQVRLIVNERNTGIAGWNRAFEAGAGDWFLVLDDDCYVQGDALARALAAAEAEHADMVSFTVDSSEPATAFSDAYRVGMLSFWGCAVLISARAVHELGGFDGRLFIWAHELEFTMRLLDRGYKHLFLPDVHALHMKPVGPPTVAGHRRNMRNWGYVAGKLLQPRHAGLALANLCVRALLEAAIDLGHARGAPAAVAGFVDGLRVREPVRSEVSRLYRRHFLEFGSFVRLGMRARHLLVDRLAPGTDFRRRFWRERPRLYPSETTAIRVP